MLVSQLVFFFALSGISYKLICIAFVYKKINFFIIGVAKVLAMTEVVSSHGV